MATTAPARPLTAARLLSLPVVSWALYDLANTIFSMNIVSLYLGLWVVNVMGGSDATWGYANSLSMLLVLLTAPLLGALSDQAGRRLPFLLASTLACVALTALLGTPGLAASLALFVFANYFFQAGLIFYDATLPAVSTPENRGRVGGLGIALGYVGSFLGVGIGRAFLESHGYVFVFRMTALLFLLFALPIFLFVPEPRRASALRLGRNATRRAFRQVAETVRHARRYRGLGRFLLGRAFYADAVNTVIIFMGLYVTNEVGFTTNEAQLVLLVAIATAAAGAYALGHVVDRIGPRRTLHRVLALWAVALAGAFTIAVAGLPKALFWIVACLAGIALGGTWAADRPYLLVLTPPRRVGEFYGLYSLVGRFAAVVGPALWSFVADTLGLGRPAAIATMLLLIAISYFILRGVDDAPRAWAPEER